MNFIACDKNPEYVAYANHQLEQEGIGRWVDLNITNNYHQ